MNLDILFNASPAIQLHVYSALLAFIVGALVLWKRKGTTNHKRWGKIWVVLMVLTALTSFFIHEIRLFGPFSPIHLISLGTMASLYFAVKQVRSGDVNSHQRSMKATYIGGMGIAGALAFTPGRLMYDVALEPIMNMLSLNGWEVLDVSVFNGAWQLPVLVFAVIFIIVFAKSAYEFLSAK